MKTKKLPEGLSVDIDVLMKLKDFQAAGEDLVTQLINLFFATNVPRLKRMNDFITTKNLEYLKQEAHGLKVSCAYMGAMRMADTCKKLEKAADAKDDTKSIRLLQDVQEEFGSVKRELEQIVRHDAHAEIRGR